MAILAVIQEYTPGYCRNSRNPMTHPPRREMKPESPALAAEQFRVPNQTRKEPQCARGTPESPQDHCHNMRGTLFSPQECNIPRCTTSLLKMKPISPSLAP